MTTGSGAVTIEDIYRDSNDEFVYSAEYNALNLSIMKKHRMLVKIILDILFYIAMPLFFWNFLRECLGGYFTLLLAAIPGSIYALITFLKEKEHRITGYVFLGGMIVARLMDLVVSSPEQILWNDVRVNLCFAALWSISMLVKRPIGMYFFLDYASYAGLDYNYAKRHYLESPKLLKYFYWFTLMLLCQDMFLAGVYTVFIKIWGIAGYNKILLITSVINYLNIGCIVLFVSWIIKRIKKYL